MVIGIPVKQNRLRFKFGWDNGNWISNGVRLNNKVTNNTRSLMLKEKDILMDCVDMGRIGTVKLRDIMIA